MNSYGPFSSENSLKEQLVKKTLPKSNEQKRVQRKIKVQH